ncbi:hypothetical protein SAMN05444392_102408 [Seinonella peptonophila]|uniref:Uncharacterized protein n=1 Tax=Seinonella peptonophila TaxID=112248 RepID=A0A1M4VL19_9BACL|nr:hypothetical protein [Seinonella peptonophila]SHE69522.1 hypothetical protein SAMN05444392_102408 [Seinonella peptonophila]
MIEVVYMMKMKADNGLMLVDQHEFDFEIDHPNQLSDDYHEKICDFLLDLYEEEEEGLEPAYQFVNFSYQGAEKEVDLTNILQKTLQKRKNQES